MPRAVVSDVVHGAAPLMLLDASGIDPEIAADWNELQLLRHRLFARVIGDFPTADLTKGLTKKTAINTAWTIASPQATTFSYVVWAICVYGDSFVGSYSALAYAA
jgi:hypothetical protein